MEYANFANQHDKNMFIRFLIEQLNGYIQYNYNNQNYNQEQQQQPYEQYS